VPIPMDVVDFDIDEEDGLSTALGTESLAARGMRTEAYWRQRIHLIYSGN